ncbi:hypothetical protein D3C72_2544910 [compost metagenome]
MNSQSCTPKSAEESSKPAINLGCAPMRRIRSTARRHSPDTSMNTVMQGKVSSMRQPKISTPLKGVSSDV